MGYLWNGGRDGIRCGTDGGKFCKVTTGNGRKDIMASIYEVFQTMNLAHSIGDGSNASDAADRITKALAAHRENLTDYALEMLEGAERIQRIYKEKRIPPKV